MYAAANRFRVRFLIANVQHYLRLSKQQQNETIISCLMYNNYTYRESANKQTKSMT